MRLLENTNIDFTGKRRIAFIISAIVILTGVISLIINNGPKYGIDFTGGITIELDLSPVNADSRQVQIEEVRQVMLDADMLDVEIQTLRGVDDQIFFLFKTQEEGTSAEDIINVIRTNFPEHSEKQDFIRLQEQVGPRIGEELRSKAFLAIFYALLGIILYIWWRFELTFGVAAVVALFHDIIITVGIFSITGKEISLAIVAALLTIVGYSLNDTIVIFDRIREDLRIYRKESYASVINHSINETLSRTIITSLTTFIVVLSLYIFGGAVIRDFAFALLIGIVVGTYSSIFVASPILVEYFTKRNEKKKLLRKK